MPEKQQREQEEQSDEEKKSNGELKGDSQILNFNKPDFVFIPKGNHEYRQQGPYLICYSCELQHAVFIGMEKMMVGINKKGQPIIRKRF